MRRRLLPLLLALLLVGCMCVTAHAHEVPDLTADDCTIRVDLKSGGSPVSGGSLMLFRVGDIQEDDGNYFFVWNDAFSDSMLQMDVQSQTVAAELLEYADEQGIAPAAKANADENGRAVFFDLTPGLYLVAQDVPADGYLGFSPFLVGLPNYEDGTYVYNVNASPKVDDIQTLPTEPETTAPTTEPDETLPQTGQLNWPVPVMAVAGLLLFALGWILRAEDRKGNYEE